MQWNYQIWKAPFRSIARRGIFLSHESSIISSLMELSQIRIGLRHIIHCQMMLDSLLLRMIKQSIFGMTSSKGFMMNSEYIIIQMDYLLFLLIFHEIKIIIFLKNMKEIIIGSFQKLNTIRIQNFILKMKTHINSKMILIIIIKKKSRIGIVIRS